MRLAIPVVLLLVAAASRDGCGRDGDRSGGCVTEGTVTCPHRDCLGKACGEPCNPCGPDDVCPTLIASACDLSGRCVGDVPGICTVTDCSDEPCGTACAYPCHVDGSCEPSSIPLACDGNRSCAPVHSWSCYQPCAGKSCGEPCHLCPPDAADCYETLELKACDRVGRCVSWTPEFSCG